MTGIFISYRREQNDAHAHLLRDRLKASFPGRVFMDVAGTSYGDDFTAKIAQQLSGCRVMLVLIGPEWERLRDEDLGGLRLHNPRDWVRVEVVSALKGHTRVIPVLVKREKMPRERDLPDDLKPLLNRQAFVLNLDQRLDSGMRDLVKKIRQEMPWFSMPGRIKSAVLVFAVLLLICIYMISSRAMSALVVQFFDKITKIGYPVDRRRHDPYQPGRRFRDCEENSCPWMVVIPAGDFMMGSISDGMDLNADESPQHKVSVKKFSIGPFEVTQGQWTALMGPNPSRFRGCGDDCPVENVSWEDAQAYVKKLSAKTGYNYRLPSEAEWEYAARAGTNTAYAFGSVLNASQANFHILTGRTSVVGSHVSNEFGLSDMHGNVAEWVQDCWHENYTGAPTGGQYWEIECLDGNRILRGGSWDNFPEGLRSASRQKAAPNGRGDGTGFRVARDLYDLSGFVVKSRKSGQ